MMWIFAIAVVLVLAVGRMTAVAASLTLVREGKPTSFIVVADEPTEAAHRGASELQLWLRRVSDATIPIRTESQIPDGIRDSLILVGDTQRTAALGLRSTTFELEEIRIRTFPRTLALICADERPDGVQLSGTLWAIETFLEQFLGVRLLWPGKLGAVTPQRSTIEVGDINLRRIPSLRKRVIRNIGYNERVQKGLDRLSWRADDFQDHHAESQPWFQFHRLGASFQGSYGHAFGDYWDRFHAEHPDWFALQPDGTRDNSNASGGHRAIMRIQPGPY